MRLLYLLFSILIVSCASKMNVDKGTFQTIKPPNIYGNSRHLEEGLHNTISLDVNIGKNKTIPLPGLVNKHTWCVDGEMCLQETPANINYRLIENAFGFQLYQVQKETSNLYIGAGGGIQSFPYIFLMFGFNGDFIEIGGTAFGGLVQNEASYEGKHSYVEPEEFCRMFGIEEHYFRFKGIKILHSYGGLAANASFYWKKFALSYAASVSDPWPIKQLPFVYSDEGEVYENDADISFSFPVLLMQDIGISYTIYKIKSRIGVNQITGVKFPGQYWGLSVQVAYGW
jgi:hypothetical protein